MCVCVRKSGEKREYSFGWGFLRTGENTARKRERERREREMISWNRIIRRNGDHLFFSCSFRFLARLLSLPFYPPSPQPPPLFRPWSGALSRPLTRLTKYVSKLTQVTAQPQTLGCELWTTESKSLEAESGMQQIDSGSAEVYLREVEFGEFVCQGKREKERERGRRTTRPPQDSREDPRVSQALLNAAHLISVSPFPPSAGIPF